MTDITDHSDFSATAPAPFSSDVIPRHQVSPSTRILRLPEVMERVGLRHTVIYEQIVAGTFPKQIALGRRAVGWLESEIEAWITQRIFMSRKAKN